MTNSEPLFDRNVEVAELERAWASGRPELLIATGRRRAGKSYLLLHFLKSHAGFYYQATQSTSREQLRAIAEALDEQLGEKQGRYGTGFRDWNAFFRFIVDHARGKPFVLVLDEVPYLLESVRGFGSLLQKQWDHALRHTRITLVLSGSYISAMQRLIAADQPLHGRRTGRLRFGPFSYQDAAAFVPGWTAKDRLKTHAIFGGLPGQLALLDPKRSLAENVARHVLGPTGRLSDEAEHLFDAFVRDGGVHYAIVRAIAQGEHKWSKIANRLGKSSASLSRPLQWLQEMEVVTRILPITEPPQGNPKRALYRLMDPYLAFWHRFVVGLRASGIVDLQPPLEVWRRFVEPGLDDYMGPHFEAVCRTFTGQSGHPRLPFRPDRVGEWWNETSDQQVDVVALGGAGEVLFGECKWGSATNEDALLLEKRADLVLRELRGIRRVHFALFTGGRIRDARLQRRIRAGELLHFTADDLFEPKVHSIR